MGWEGSGRGGGAGMGGEGPIGRWRERREKLATGPGAGFMNRRSSGTPT